MVDVNTLADDREFHIRGVKFSEITRLRKAGSRVYLCMHNNSCYKRFEIDIYNFHSSASEMLEHVEKCHPMSAVLHGTESIKDVAWGLKFLEPVHVCPSGKLIELNGTRKVDGVQTYVGWRVLLCHQWHPDNQGIFEICKSDWRPVTLNSEIPVGSTVQVKNGKQNGGKLYCLYDQREGWAEISESV